MWVSRIVDDGVWFSSQKGSHVVVTVRLGASVRREPERLSENHGWVIGEERPHNLHLCRRDPPRKAPELVFAQLRVLRLLTLLAHERDLDVFEDGLADLVGELHHLRGALR